MAWAIPKAAKISAFIPGTLPSTSMARWSAASTTARHSSPSARGWTCRSSRPASCRCGAGTATAPTTAARSLPRSMSSISTVELLRHVVVERLLPAGGEVLHHLHFPPARSLRDAALCGVERGVDDQVHRRRRREEALIGQPARRDHVPHVIERLSAHQGVALIRQLGVARALLRLRL